MSLHWTVVVCGILVPSKVWSTTLASDNAANSPYAAEAGGAWKGLDSTPGENPPGTDNGGFGFQPWDFSGGYHQPEFSPYGELNHFIDGVDFPASSFNGLGSPAFGLTNANLAYGGDTARATRVLSAPLQAGDVVTIDFDNPVPAPLDPFASAGFLFRLNAGGGPLTASDPNITERFGLFVTVGPSPSTEFNNWTVTDSAGFIDSGVAPTATASGAQFRFALTGSEGYSFELVRRSDGQTLFARSGTLASAGADSIDSIEFAMFGNGSGNGLNGAVAQPTGQREFFFNSLHVEGAQLLGDYNHNGVVDAADYVVWRNTLGVSVAQGSGADGDNSGHIDLPDFDIWKSQFGASGSGIAATAIDVPEPFTTLVGIFLSLLLSGLSSRRYGALTR